MPIRGSEAWWKEHWGTPCHGPRTQVVLGGHHFTVDTRAKTAFEAWEVVRARHGYVLHAPYPDGDSGTGNCRHIGNDPNRPWSTHAWWAALDANWNVNPQHKPLTHNYPPAMIADLEAIKTKTTGRFVFRWGGRFSTPDAMHWEIYATPDELAEGIIIPGLEEDDLPFTEQQLRTMMREEAEIAVKAYVGPTYTTSNGSILTTNKMLAEEDGAGKFIDGVKEILRLVRAIATKVGA